MTFDQLEKYIKFFSESEIILAIANNFNSIENLTSPEDINKAVSNYPDEKLNASVAQARESLQNAGNILRSEISKNCLVTTNHGRLKKYLSHTFTELKEARRLYGHRFRLNQLEVVLNEKWESLSPNAYHLIDSLIYFDSLAEGLQGFVLSQQPAVILQAPVGKSDQNFREADYLIEPAIIKNLYNNYNGIWWERMQDWRFASYFDKSVSPPLFIRKHLIEGKQNEFVYFLSYLKKDGKHKSTQGRDPNDLVDDKFAKKHFGIINYKDLKSQAKAHKNKAKHLDKIMADIFKLSKESL